MPSAKDRTLERPGLRSRACAWERSQQGPQIGLFSGPCWCSRPIVRAQLPERPLRRGARQLGALQVPRPDRAPAPPQRQNRSLTPRRPTWTSFITPPPVTPPRPSTLPGRSRKTRLPASKPCCAAAPPRPTPNPGILSSPPPTKARRASPGPPPAPTPTTSPRSATPRTWWCSAPARPSTRPTCRPCSTRRRATAASPPTRRARPSIAPVPTTWTGTVSNSATPSTGWKSRSTWPWAPCCWARPRWASTPAPWRGSTRTCSTRSWACAPAASPAR